MAHTMHTTTPTATNSRTPDVRQQGRKAWTLPVLSLIVFIVTLGVNLASMMGWMGATQEEVSNRYRNFITPEPFTFSIWGVIYLLVLVALIYQLVITARTQYVPERLDRFNYLFIVSCILNIGWNWLWINDQMSLSTVVILLFTIVLALLARHLRLSVNGVYSVVLPVAFGIYLGWLTVATATNVAAWLVKMEWGMFGIEEHLWACLTYIAIVLIVGVIIARVRNSLMVLPVIWAFVGVLVMLYNNPPKPIHHNQPHVVIGVMIALATIGVVTFIKNGKRIA